MRSALVVAIAVVAAARVDDRAQGANAPRINLMNAYPVPSATTGASAGRGWTAGLEGSLAYATLTDRRTANAEVKLGGPVAINPPSSLRGRGVPSRSVAGNVGIGSSGV